MTWGGKKTTLKREHALIGAETAAAILKRLRASNELINRVKILIAEHMFEIHPTPPPPRFADLWQR